MSSGNVVADQVGLRNQLRARWKALPERDRHLYTIGLELLFSVLCWFVDTALGYGVAVVFICLWLRRLPPVPWRLVVEGAVVAVFAIASAVGNTSVSVCIVLAYAFALSWIPAGKRRWLLPLILVVTGVVYPFFVDKLFTIPVFGSFPTVATGTGTYVIVFIMMAVGLNMVVGYAGLLDLGYVAFYATGAYTAGWFASSQFAGQKCPKPGFTVDTCPVANVPKLNFDLGAVGVPQGTGGFHISLFGVLLIAGVITGLFGIIIGLPTLRLRGDYLAIVTLGFGEILPQVARNGGSLGGFNLTNGANGITPIDSPGFGNHLSHWTDGILPSNYLTCCHWTLNIGNIHHQIQSADLFFWTALVLLVLTVFCSLRLRDSRLGRAWVAIREDETAAAAMGIPLMRTKTWAYASGAFFGGVAGAYYASQKSGTFPDDFYFNISVFVLCMVILGGMGNVYGVIVGAAFLAYLNVFGLGNIGNWINTHIHVFGHHPNIDVPLYASGIYGLIIVVVMLFRPEGLIPSARRKAELHEAETHDQPLYDLQHEGV
jgi:branched-chain amino acid transport system permease protein